jgi:hypothetical protein
MRRTLGRLLRFAPGLAVAATLMFPTTAAAATTSIQPVSATLIAKGAAVNLTVSFTCPLGDTVVGDLGGGNGGLFAFMQQAVSKTQQATANGAGGGQACTGSPQTATLSMLSNASGPPFRVGPAVAEAFMTECDTTGFICTTVSSGLTTVRISK